MVARNTSVSLPTDLVEALEPRARAMGMDLGAYIAHLADLAQGAESLESVARDAGMDLPTFLHFARRVSERKHDAAFVDAAKFAFSNYPDTLRGLAQ